MNPYYMELDMQHGTIFKIVVSLSPNLENRAYIGLG